jgi:hypothetical protein
MDLEPLIARALRVAAELRTADAAELQRQVTEKLGPMPRHRWVEGTKLQFELPGGVWGEAVDLQGPKGERGEPGGVGLVRIDAAPSSGPAMTPQDWLIVDEQGRALLTPDGRCILAIGQP